MSTLRPTCSASGRPPITSPPAARRRGPPIPMPPPPPMHSGRRSPCRPPRATGDDDAADDEASTSWEGWQDWAGPPPQEGGAAGEGPEAEAPAPPSSPSPPPPPAGDDPNAGWDAPIYRRSGRLPPPTNPASPLGGLWGTWPWLVDPAAAAAGRTARTPDGRPGPARPPRRAPTLRGPRDEFMRPIADGVGVRLRLGPDPGAAEDEYGEEALANAAESGAGAAFAGGLLGLPLAAGFAAGHLLGAPALEVARAQDPRVLAPTPRQRGEGGRALREHEVRLRMEAAVGRSPPLNDAQTVAALKEEAARLDASFRARNAASLVRLVSDTVGGATLGALLVIPSPGRTSFFGAISRVFSGLSDMAKAFLIIASTDIFLGYHSEEGWKALAHVVTSYYGIEVGEGSVYAFVAVVPVVADAFFKLYIFKGLNRTNPGSAVTLKSMKKS